MTATDVAAVQDEDVVVLVVVGFEVDVVVVVPVPEALLVVVVPLPPVIGVWLDGHEPVDADE